MGLLNNPMYCAKCGSKLDETARTESDGFDVSSGQPQVRTVTWRTCPSRGRIFGTDHTAAWRGGDGNWYDADPGGTYD